jgi:hypothetical protein
MVTATQVSRLNAKLDVLVAAIDTDSKPITVVVFSGETREFALQRHRELRLDHAGRPVRFEHRNVPRTEVAEMFSVHTPDELQAVLDRIEAKGRGKPIGEQVLADAHGRGDERDPPNHPD